MTDTTDQQAVTVAQEAREVGARLVYEAMQWAVANREQSTPPPWAPYGNSFAQVEARTKAGRILDLVTSPDRLASVSSASDDRRIVGIATTPAEIDDFFASVSSASADYVLVPREPTEAMVNACQDNLYSSNPSWNNPREIWSAMLAVSPEPVPATNQAGEVANLRQALRNIAEGNLGDAPWQANYARIKEVATAALATQPATSQEGAWLDQIDEPRLEKICDECGYAISACNKQALARELANRYYRKQGMPGLDALALAEQKYPSIVRAATPTPPALSEDLRALVEQEAVDIITDLIGANAAQSGTNCRVVEDRLKQFARAALAQVKAS